MSEQETLRPQIGETVTVVTGDRHRFAGRVLEVRSRDGGRGEEVLLRLDSGWQVRYPLAMIRREVRAGRRPGPT